MICKKKKSSSELLFKYNEFIKLANALNSPKSCDVKHGCCSYIDNQLHYSTIKANCF